jgi:hypothetical protein
VPVSLAVPVSLPVPASADAGAVAGTDTGTGTGTGTGTETGTDTETELHSSCLGQRSTPLDAFSQFESSVLRIVPARRLKFPANACAFHSIHDWALS